MIITINFIYLFSPDTMDTEMGAPGGIHRNDIQFLGAPPVMFP